MLTEEAYKNLTRLYTYRRITGAASRSASKLIGLTRAPDEMIVDPAFGMGVRLVYKYGPMYVSIFVDCDGSGHVSAAKNPKWRKSSEV